MKKPISKILIIGVPILAITILLTVLLLCVRIVVPDITGKSIFEGKKLLNKRTFRVQIEKEYSDTVPENFIISQENSSGEALKIGSVVTIKVSKGIEPIELPNVENITVDEAKSALENLKFTVKITEKFDDFTEKGNVISQEVAAGDKAPKGSEIELIISKGPDLVVVPKVTGKTLEAAKQALLDAGLNITTDIKCSNSVKEGKIISQDIKSGEMIKRHSAVLVYVSAGVANTVGNTPSNSVNWGRVASQGNWVYYSNTRHDYYLYKMRHDGSERQLLTTDVVLGINVVGEWIYYTNEDRSGNGGLYKIRIDGTQKTKISSEINYFVHVANGWIYTSNLFGDRKLYRMKLDGSQKTLICDDRCGNVNIIDNWIYYTVSNDFAVYKMRVDGSGKTKIRDNFYGDGMTVCGNTIVATNTYEVLRINTDGGGFYRYSENRKSKAFMNSNNGWIYFMEHDFKDPEKPKTAFYKMRSDASQKTKILDLDFKNHANFFICVAGDWLYFPNDDDGDRLYRVKTDGTVFQKVYN